MCQNKSEGMVSLVQAGIPGLINRWRLCRTARQLQCQAGKL
jgi:hypothetical protein